MQDIYTYHIEIRGRVEEAELNVLSPFEITVVQTGSTITLIAACTDQSGLIGLMRHLHSRGFVLLSVTSLK